MAELTEEQKKAVKVFGKYIKVLSIELKKLIDKKTDANSVTEHIGLINTLLHDPNTTKGLKLLEWYNYIQKNIKNLASKFPTENETLSTKYLNYFWNCGNALMQLKKGGGFVDPNDPDVILFREKLRGLSEVLQNLLSTLRNCFQDLKEEECAKIRNATDLVRKALQNKEIRDTLKQENLLDEVEDTIDAVELALTEKNTKELTNQIGDVSRLIAFIKE